MNETDNWGHDPSVQQMRQVFFMMDAGQRRLLKDGEISPFDTRLRRGRDTARALFETSWSLASSRGMDVTAEEIAVLYAICLAGALNRVGLKVPEEAVPEHERLTALVQEVLP